MQSRRWSFTLNNYPEHVLDAIKNGSIMNSFAGHVTYLHVGTETGENGTPHLQGYLETKKKVTLSGLKKLFGDLQVSPHLEVARGTLQQNIDYCSKESPLIICGEPMKPGKRTDLDDIKRDIDEGMRMDGLWENHFSKMIQYRRGFEAYIDTRAKQRSEPPKVFIYYGDTSGTGKTRTAFSLAEEYGEPFVYMGGGWFDGYCGQRLAIFDEFDGRDLDFPTWKRLVDRYAMRVPIKGGSVNWGPEVIVFTSNFHYKLWWPGVPMPTQWIQQLERRVSLFRNFDEEPWTE